MCPCVPGPPCRLQASVHTNKTALDLKPQAPSIQIAPARPQPKLALQACHKKCAWHSLCPHRSLGTAAQRAAITRTVHSKHPVITSVWQQPWQNGVSSRALAAPDGGAHGLVPHPVSLLAAPAQGGILGPRACATVRTTCMCAAQVTPGQLQLPRAAVLLHPCATDACCCKCNLTTPTANWWRWVPEERACSNTCMLMPVQIVSKQVPV